MPIPDVGFRGLYNSAMRIGQDHVAATVNTLVLAYAGASLPMLLLFSLARGDYGYLVNFSFIAEEIVRTLVGSLGLIAAVPITTAIAILLAHKGRVAWEVGAGPRSRRKRGWSSSLSALHHFLKDQICQSNRYLLDQIIHCKVRRTARNFLPSPA